jgi:hypothetical protein
MRRAVYLAMLVAAGALAQSSDSYHDAYRTWREADPNLERDAAGGGAAVQQRANRVAAEAAKYGAGVSKFLLQLAADQGQALAALESAAAAALPAVAPADLDQSVASARAAVRRNIEVLAKDTDRGIQQVRQALGQERDALDALSNAIAERQRTAAAAQTATAAAEQARLKALESYRELAAGLKETSAQADRETAAWAEYYRKLAEGAQDSVTTAAASVNPAPRPPSITPVPLVRYTGDWIYPATNGLYHGAQPESVELTAREENGRATGSLSARFKLPQGSRGDPELRFDFAGDFKSTRNQVFDVTTSDGSKGTIELIPGSAFNLLEVNVAIDAKPGKVRQANFVLVKK